MFPGPVPKGKMGIMVLRQLIFLYISEGYFRGTGVLSLLFDYRVGQGLFQKVIFEAGAGCCPARPCIVGKSCKKNV